MAPPRARQPEGRNSSANPFKLQTYATDGMALGTTLQAKVTALGDAVDNLARAGGSIPRMSDLRATVEDLAADWYHLDEFAGDVADGFLVHLGPTRPDNPDSFVMRLDHWTIADLGQVGWADRDEAIAEAEALAEELRGLMAGLEDGEVLIHDPPHNTGMSIEAFEQLAARLDGRGDPAFAVAFVEAMGVNGMVGLRPFFEEVAGQAWDRDRPSDDYWTSSRLSAWVDAQMVGATAVLSTAMDTRSRTATHHDPAFENLPDDAQLDSGWVDRFVRYGGDEQVAYSHLVMDAELPADVLVGVGNYHLGDVFGHPDEDRGPSSTEADLNILDAIAADPDASVGWLGSDGIAEDTDNLELVLTYEGRGRVSGELYDGMAGVVESGLTHPTDTAGRGELMRDTITIVGADGDTLWDPEETDRSDAAAAHMHQALANGAAANMDVVHSMINDDWTRMHLGQPEPENAQLTYDFFRELTQDESAADTLNAAVVEHTVQGIAAAPAAGEARIEALRALGAVQGTLVGAESDNLFDSVEDYVALQERRADTVNFVVGLVPYGKGLGDAAGSAVSGVNDLADIYGGSLGEILYDPGAGWERMNEAEQVHHMMRTDLDVNNAIMLAQQLHPERAAVAAEDMTPDQRRAFIEWLASDPAPYDYADQDALGMGGHRAMDAFLADRWQDA